MCDEVDTPATQSKIIKGRASKYSTYAQGYDKGLMLEPSGCMQVCK